MNGERFKACIHQKVLYIECNQKAVDATLGTMVKDVIPDAVVRARKKKPQSPHGCVGRIIFPSCRPHRGGHV